MCHLSLTGLLLAYGPFLLCDALTITSLAAKNMLLRVPMMLETHVSHSLGTIASPVARASAVSQSCSIVNTVALTFAC